MTGKGTSDEEKFNVDIIFKNCFSDFNNIHKELMDALKKEPAFIRLKKIGENQFHDATSKSSIERESQLTRLFYAEMNSLLEEIMQKADTLISSKLNSNFHIGLEDLVLSTITKLYPLEQKNDKELSENENVLSPAGLSDKNQKKTTRKRSSEVSSESLNDTSIKIIDLSDTENAQKILSKKNEESLESEFGDDTLDSLSSVHTSDLSSFDDCLVFSSDEETGSKRKRMSMEEAEKRLAELKSQNSQKTKQNQNKDTSKLETTVKESSVIPQKPSRVRKPNSRYFADEILPFKQTSENISTPPASAVNNPLPKKRGRPRKHFT